MSDHGHQRVINLIDNSADRPLTQAEHDELAQWCQEPALCAAAADHLAMLRLLPVASRPPESLAPAIIDALNHDRSAFVAAVQAEVRQPSRRPSAASRGAAPSRRTRRRRRTPRNATRIAMAASLVSIIALGVGIAILAQQSTNHPSPSTPAPLQPRLSPSTQSAASWQPLQGDAVTLTGPDAFDQAGTLTLGDGSTIALAEATWASVADRFGRGLMLDQGSLRIVAQPQRPEQPLIVATPLATVSVIGTQFEVTHRARGTTVTVTEGVVSVTDTAGHTQRLAGGAYAEIPAATQPTRLTGFRLVDPTSKQPLTDRILVAEERLDRSQSVDLEAVASGERPGSVEFLIDGQRASQQREAIPPFTIAGGFVGDHRAWQPPVGSFTIEAIAWSGPDYNGEILDRLTLRVKSDR